MDDPGKSAPTRTPPRSEHGGKVSQYYASATAGWERWWHPDHIHFGVFEPGECPENRDSPASPGFTRALERMIDEIANPIGIREGDHIVDAGCGIGGTAIYLAKTAGCTVTGVNITDEQLDRARKKVAAANLAGRINFAWADCSLHLPFDDDSVDAVVNIESACHYSDRSKFLREVFRILKPGGRIGAMDWMVRDGLSDDDYEQHIAPVCEAWTVHSLWDPSTYAWRVRDAGLELLEFEGFRDKDRDNLRLLEQWHRALFFLAMATGNMDTPAIRQSINACGTLCSAWRDGYFVLERYCAVKPEPS